MHISAMQASAGESVRITCYEDSVPPFAAATLERLYQSLYASLAMYRIYNPDTPVSTYFAEDAWGEPRALFLYRRTGERLVVCNEVMRLEGAEVARFCAWAFARYPEIAAIAFRAIESELRRLPFPFQRANVLEDIVVHLPATVEEYSASLGKSTRRTVRGYMNRLKRAWPGWRFEVSEGAAIREQDVLDIVRMNHARMSAKDKVSAYDAAETQRILRLARTCGMVAILRLDGRACAGSVSFRVGRHYYMSIAAHDPLYDAYRLGTLASFLIICECIRRGGAQCHLMWGRHDYKFRFQGELRELDNLTVYRSPLAMLRHGEAVLREAWQSAQRSLRRQAEALRRADGLAWRLLASGAQTLRGMRRAWPWPGVDVAAEREQR